MLTWSAKEKKVSSFCCIFQNSLHASLSARKNARSIRVAEWIEESVNVSHMDASHQLAMTLDCWICWLKLHVSVRFYVSVESIMECV